MELLHPLSGFVVGLMVGLTGVGGGSLMAPLMILLLGVAPTTAVGTDLWFAGITKIVGGSIHHSQGNADWQVVRRLAWGSLPAAILTLWFLSTTDTHQLKSGFVVQALGGVLVLTAFVTLMHSRIYVAAASLAGDRIASYRRALPALTILAGSVLGVVVTLTSVGAGAIGATLLVTLYPLRMTPKKVIGTDIVHAVPLTLLAGIGHFWLGHVNFKLLVSLLAGSIPGIIIGARLTRHLNMTFLRIALAGMLFFSGARLLM